MAAPLPSTSTAQSQVTLPRVSITYCTQCKWLLRAAWLQQELLSTFATSIGEIALVPATGGIFRIHLLYRPAVSDSSDSSREVEVKEAMIWDRKVEGGFPEAKVLKQRVRDCIEPGRGLGHSDTPSQKGEGGTEAGEGGDGKKVVDLAGPVRDKGSSNPLVQRMRPGMAKEDGERKKECDDCQ